VHAIPDATQLVTIIVPHERHLRVALSDDQDAYTASLTGLYAKPKARTLILKERIGHCGTDDSADEDCVVVSFPRGTQEAHDK
jgi:hypothetical protein